MKKTTRASSPSYSPEQPAAVGPRRTPSKTRVRKTSEPIHEAALAPPPASGPQRLHKVLALAGLGSRREMETIIEAGRITVNGELAKLGMTVAPADVIRLDKRIVRLQESGQLPKVLIYHKPEGEIVSRDDPEKRPSVFEKLPRIRGAKWVAIGRLDFNTCGLLVFTTSGELANRFTHPRYEVEREYAVRILGGLNEAQMLQLTEGVELDDGIANFDVIQDRGGEGVNHWYQIILHEGKNREVRRLFEALGLQVSRLMRVRFGPLNLPSRLRRGQMLELEPKEVRELLEWAGMPVPAVPQRQQSPREREQLGKAFTPKARKAMDEAERKPRAGGAATRANTAKASSPHGFNPATKQRRSDRNRNRG